MSDSATRGMGPDDRALFSERTRTVVFSIAVLSLVATFAALVFGRRLSSPPPQPRDSYGMGPLGHHAFVSTLEALNIGVVRWTQPRWDAVQTPLFIIEPNAPELTIEGRTVGLGDLVRTRMTAERPTVLVLPKWSPAWLGSVAPDPVRDLYALLDELPVALAVERMPPGDEWAALDVVDDSGVTRRLELRWPQRVTGGVPLVADDAGSFVVSDPKGMLFVVSDPDLLHNFNIQRGDHAAFWGAFIRDRLRAESVVIDEVFHGAIEVRSFAELFGEWPGVLVLIHGVFVALTVLLMGRKRFGPPAPAAEGFGPGPREVIGVAASVLENGSRVSTLAARYIEGLVFDLHRQLGLHDGKGVDERATQIDAVARSRDVAPLAAELMENARALEGSAKAGAALALARKAAEFRAQLLDAKRPMGTRGVAAHRTQIRVEEEERR